MHRSYDVVIIGSGAAGCAAAIEAAHYTRNILLVTRSGLGYSNTLFAQGGIQSPLGGADSKQRFYNDIIKAGENKNNPALVRTLVDHAGETIHWLEDLGVKFDRDLHTGDYLLRGCAGTSIPRVLSCGDMIGTQIIKSIIRDIKQRKIPYRQHSKVTRIENKGLFEIYCLNNQSAKEYKITARTAIITTGGAAQLEASKRGIPSTNCQDADGSGMDIARGLGITIIDENNFQLHPTAAVLPQELEGRPIPETMRSCGADLVNGNGNRFIDPLITRNRLAKAIMQECKRGQGIRVANKQGVWLTTPEIDRINGDGFTQSRFPTMYTIFRRRNHLITKRPLLVYPAVHYHLGGIKIDSKCRTNVPGIYCAGEAATGVHGADRLMGISLLETLVFGRIAGRSAALWSMGVKNDE